MYIANPIYDTVFKHLMENNRVARFFVETIIGQPVESIVVSPQERTVLKLPPTFIETGELTTEEKDKLIEYLSVLRYDFLATIRTPEGHKKVLIEIQKARNAFDLVRFRNYLDEKYKRKDVITVDDKETEASLPIITIYMLGFGLPETDAVIIHVNRIYRDVLEDGKILNVKNKFIECLTHDSYVVQIPYIKEQNRNRLEKMLSLFEQNNFYNEKRILKKFLQEVDDENIRLMLEILTQLGADPEQQEEMELEWRSCKFLADYFMVEEQGRALEKRKRALEEQAGLQQKIAEQAARIAELERRLGLS